MVCQTQNRQVTATITIRVNRLTDVSILQQFYNILTFKRRLWPHTVLYWPHIVLLLDHVLQCITPWRWPRGAETCRSVCIYNKHTEVHLLDVVILKKSRNLIKITGRWHNSLACEARGIEMLCSTLYNPSYLLYSPLRVWASLITDTHSCLSTIYFNLHLP
jgi:hypothetical protein